MQTCLLYLYCTFPKSLWYRSLLEFTERFQKTSWNGSSSSSPHMSILTVLESSLKFIQVVQSRLCVFRWMLTLFCLKFLAACAVLAHRPVGSQILNYTVSVCSLNWHCVPLLQLQHDFSMPWGFLIFCSSVRAVTLLQSFHFHIGSLNNPWRRILAQSYSAFCCK